MSSKVNTDLVLILMPFWHTRFPPYALARLAGVARSHGYKTEVFDINLAASVFLADQLGNKWDADSALELSSSLFNKMHLFLEPLLSDYIEQIVELNPKIIGFTLYRSNTIFTYWIARKLKERLPSVKIILGGVEVRKKNFIVPSYIDHVVIGDGEKALLDILQEIPNMKIINSIGNFDINNLAMPDYSDFDLKNYIEVGIFPVELSRGCTASCSFCETTSYWKYRSRTGKSAFEEVKHMISEYGAKNISFVDHLLNGNIAELKLFADKLIEEDVNIHWYGFARCNKKMDLEYIQNLKNAGCQGLTFGTESGSETVLKLMNKQITASEIDHNLSDCKKAGIEVITMWIVGFPGEEKSHFSETLEILWRNRNNISFMIGAACTIPNGSKLELSPARFGLDLGSRKTLRSLWQMQDMTNTCLHRATRAKIIHIFFNELKQFGYEREYDQRYKWVEDDYNIDYLSDTINDQIFLENFDYSIIDTNHGIFVDSLVNEPFTLFRTLWRAIGSFKMSFSVGSKDCLTYIFKNVDYSAINAFEINNDGVWSFNTDHKFIDRPEPNATDYSFSYKGEAKGKW